MCEEEIDGDICGDKREDNDDVVGEISHVVTYTVCVKCKRLSYPYRVGVKTRSHPN